MAAPEVPIDVDPQTMVAFVEALQPSVVLTGMRGEGGEDSGMLPYLLAEALGLPVVATGGQSRGGRIVREPDPARAAQVIFDYSKREGVVRD